jgi:hypothetical protein
MTKSIEERIGELKKRQDQLKAQERKLKARVSERERKARTKRLIETGAVLEKKTGIQLVDELDRQRFDRALELTVTLSNSATLTIGDIIVQAYKRVPEERVNSLSQTSPQESSETNSMPPAFDPQTRGDRD